MKIIDIITLSQLEREDEKKVLAKSFVFYSPTTPFKDYKSYMKVDQIPIVFKPGPHLRKNRGFSPSDVCE